MEYSNDYGPHVFPTICRGLMLRAINPSFGERWIDAQPARVQRICRAVTQGGTTLPGNWASPLVSGEMAAAIAEFKKSLSAFSVFFRLVNDRAVQVMPLRTYVAIVTSGITAMIVGEGAAKPVGHLTLANRTLTPSKVASTVVATADLLASAAPEAPALFATALREGIAAEVDAAFFQMIDPGTGSIAGTGDPWNDIRSAVAAVSLRAGSRPYWIASPSVMKTLSTLSTTDGMRMFPEVPVSGSGELCSIPILPSDGLPADEIWLLDASAVAAGFETIEPRPSREATVSMSTTPSGDSSTGTGEQMVSLWQTNSVGLIAETSLSAELLKPDAVARVVGVTWGA